MHPDTNTILKTTFEKEATRATEDAIYQARQLKIRLEELLAALEQHGAAALPGLVDRTWALVQDANRVDHAIAKGATSLNALTGLTSLLEQE